jgi:hypothetical protein
MCAPGPDRPGTGTLSVHRAFVVRLYALERDGEEISGWIEHIVSGNAKEFRSLEELRRFISVLLRGGENTAT